LNVDGGHSWSAVLVGDDFLMFYKIGVYCMLVHAVYITTSNIFYRKKGSFTIPKDFQQYFLLE
jgi:hypothetical protein